MKRRSEGRVDHWRSWNGVDISIEYKGLDLNKDREIRKVLGKWDQGSGFLFGESVRDFSAHVPINKLAGVVAKLKKIRGLTVKKLVQKWVRIR